MKVRLFFLILASIITLISASFSYQFYKSSKKFKSPEKVLRVNLSNEPSNLNPQTASDIYTLIVTKCLFEGLMREQADGKIVPAIAASFPLISEDGLTYVFKIRKNAKWSNGEKITAYDFEKSWKRPFNSKETPPLFQQLCVLKNSYKIKEGILPLEELGVHAEDDLTLIVNLENPISYFLELLCSPPFLPIYLHQGNLENELNWALKVHPSFISNGPFIITKWVYFDHLELSKNPEYWDYKHVKLDRIEFRINPDSDEQLDLYFNDQIDIIYEFEPDAVSDDRLTTLKGQGLIKNHPIAATAYYVYNTKRMPFNNVKIRKAFSLALDRQLLLKNFFDRVPAFEIVPPSFKTWESTPLFQDNNLKEAHKLLEEGLTELGIKKENLPPLAIINEANLINKKIALATQEQWKEAFDIEVQIKNMPFNAYLEKLTKQDFQIALLVWYPDYNDPITFLDHYKYKTYQQNYAAWQSSTYIDLLNRAGRAFHPDQRAQFLKQAEEFLIKEMPITPLYFLDTLYLQKDWVKNVYRSPLGLIDFKWADIDKSPSKINQAK